MQYDHVTAELPAQHPGVGGAVGAGGRVLVPAGGAVTGGSVGGEQSDGSYVEIHEQTPLYSHVVDEVNSLQNSPVRTEYPAQHPTSGVGDGVGFEVGGIHSGEYGSPESQSHCPAAPQDLESSMLLQNVHD